MTEVVSGWRLRSRPIDVSLDDWCEGDLGQQRDDGGSFTTISKGQEDVESPGSYVDD